MEAFTRMVGALTPLLLILLIFKFVTVTPTTPVGPPPPPDDTVRTPLPPPPVDDEDDPENPGPNNNPQGGDTIVFIPGHPTDTLIVEVKAPEVKRDEPKSPDHLSDSLRQRRELNAIRAQMEYYNDNTTKCTGLNSLLAFSLKENAYNLLQWGGEFYTHAHRYPKLNKNRFKDHLHQDVRNLMEFIKDDEHQKYKEFIDQLQEQDKLRDEYEKTLSARTF